MSFRKTMSMATTPPPAADGEIHTLTKTTMTKNLMKTPTENPAGEPHGATMNKLNR